MRPLVLVVLLAGCGSGVPAPKHAPDLPADQVIARRVALYAPGMQMLHQVALDMPGRSDVMVGRMRFPAAERYHLQAQTPFGLDLFTLAFDGEKYSHEVADPLKGRFPAEALAREIGRIYLHACGPDAKVSGTYELRCPGLVERLDPKTLAVRQRTFSVAEPTPRTIDVRYDEYGWFEGRWLAKRIVLVSGDYRVEVLLTGLSQ